MRILDIDASKAIDNVILYLTKEEASQLQYDLQSLLENFQVGNHHHINDVDYKREITVTIYDENDVTELDERSRRIIQEDC